MLEQRGAALAGLAGAFVVTGGIIVTVALLSDSSGVTPTDSAGAIPTVSQTPAGGTEPAPSVALATFNPTPDVCLDSLEPPPCVEQTASWLSGYLEIEPTRFTEMYAGFPVIQANVEAGRGPSDFTSPPPNAADFEARAWDAQGKKVPRVSLDLIGVVAMASAAAQVDSSGYFVSVDIFLPGTAGFSRVELVENDTVVHEWTAGPQAPVIESVTMTEGPDGLLIEWAASDPDGDDLSYLVMLVDGDGNRQTLGLGPVTDTSMLVDWNYSHGPGPHRAFVAASDGMNTSWAVTGPLATANQPPELYSWGREGTEFSTTLRNSFALEVRVQDPEGEHLEDQVVWTSSIDGYLTTGSELYLSGDHVLDGPPISLGVHTITATVTDSGGASASLSWTVTVEP